MSEWISVKESVPDLEDQKFPSRDVLLVDDKNCIWVGYRTLCGWTVYGYEYDLHYNPTHWMQLPKPPLADG